MRKRILGGLLIIFSLLFAADVVKMPSVEAAGLLERIVIHEIQKNRIMKQLKYLDNDGRHIINQQLRQNNGVSQDPQMNALLDDIMKTLIKGIYDSRFDRTVYNKPYQWFVNNGSGVNAFCTLGHNISVNRGLFTFFGNNPDEIAATVAHELAHGQRNHALKGYYRKEGTALLRAALNPNANYLGRLMVTSIANYVDSVGITQAQEKEADRLAFEYMARSEKYNVGACVAQWERIISRRIYDGTSHHFMGKILKPSDHPKHEKRRKMFAEMLTEYSYDHVTVKEADIYIDKKPFLHVEYNKSDMSSNERAAFIAGSLAKIYHKAVTSIPKAEIKDDVLVIDNQIVLDTSDTKKNLKTIAEDWGRINSLINPMVNRQKVLQRIAERNSEESTEESNQETESSGSRLSSASKVRAFGLGL